MDRSIWPAIEQRFQQVGEWLAYVAQGGERPRTSEYIGRAATQEALHLANAAAIKSQRAAEIESLDALYLSSEGGME